MADPQMQQKGPTHGGDDDSTPLDPNQQKKPNLKKFHFNPDMNIRDVFWSIMDSYASKTPLKKSVIDELENSRHSLARIAISTLQKPESSYYDISPHFIAQYTLMFFMDAGWEDTGAEFIVKSFDISQKSHPAVVFALTALLGIEQYQTILSEWFMHMIRKRGYTEGALAYVSELQLEKLSSYLKKELIIIARGDIEKNQYNAITALSILLNDSEVLTTIISLINHWDEETRKLVAQILQEIKGNATLKASASNRLAIEDNDYVKRLLLKIVAQNNDGMV